MMNSIVINWKMDCYKSVFMDKGRTNTNVAEETKNKKIQS